MEKKEQYKGHVLAIPYPTQGHINPMLQFCKHLSTTRPIKSTLVLTAFIAKTMTPRLGPAVGIDTISDGYDTDGFAKAESIESYVATQEAVGRRSLSDLILRHSTSAHPITCVVYDSFLSWALDVAKDHGLVATAFFAQPCTVNYIYYHLHRGLWRVEEIEYPVKVPGLDVELEKEDMPSFVGLPTTTGLYAAYLQLFLNQHSSVDKADCVLVNTLYELEPQVVDSMSRQCPILPIGPTLPSAYLDEQDKDDKDYGLHLFNVKDSPTTITNWLSTKSPGSVIYVSFGSMSLLEKEQIKELAHALKQSNYAFLWVVRAIEKPKLPKDIVEEMSALGKGMFVEWCSQLQVLGNGAIGCFLTHCGWNSTLEGLSMGVPMVGLPQWSDQPTNARLVQDLWRVGMKARGDEIGIVRREEIVGCIREVMKGEKAEEMRGNARRWRDLAKRGFAHGGSSDRNIDVFLSKFVA